VWNVLCNYGVSTIVARVRRWVKSTQSTNILPNNYFKQDKQLLRKNVGRSRNRSCNGNPTVRSVCIVELNVAVTVNREKERQVI
jgi:hypothetical protein